MESLAPVKPNAVAMLINKHTAGCPVLVLKKKPDEELWMVVNRYGRKMAVPTSHLMMIDGYERRGSAMDVMVINNYKRSKSSK